MIFGEGPIIKNIAGDLNKLFLQGSRVNQPINNVEGDAAADQGTVQLMADRDPVIRDISTGLGWAGREVTVSGTGALQLVNSLGRPLKSWSVELAPYQEGSGDPSPENVRPIRGTNKLTITTAGKNLFDISNLWANGERYMAGGEGNIHIGINLPAGVYTISTNVIDNSNPQVASVFATQGVSSVDGPASSSWGVFLNRPRTITVADGNMLWIYIRNVSNTGYLVWDENSFAPYYVQIELGSTATDYEPYHGNTYAITLPQTVYTGTVGSDGGESRSTEIILNGTQTINNRKYDGISNSVVRWDLSIPAKAVSVNSLPPALCESMKPVINNMIGNFNAWSGNADFASSFTIASDGARVGIALPISLGITNDSTLNAYLAANPIKVVYDVAEPTEFAVTAPSVPTADGDGYIWITAENGIITSFSATYLQSE